MFRHSFLLILFLCLSRNNKRCAEVRREICRGSRRNVDVGEFKVVTGDFGVDEKDFRSAVVDGRLELVELDGVVDEGE